uniref:Uncharacterized protein n=1 Tax=Timema poppense TaxID=170557 RepID=A0A7R9DM26_TIMPO|nr:unnamed protein product [Timema poppensis]
MEVFMDSLIEIIVDVPVRPNSAPDSCKGFHISTSSRVCEHTFSATVCANVLSKTCGKVLHLQEPDAGSLLNTLASACEDIYCSTSLTNSRPHLVYWATRPVAVSSLDSPVCTHPS